MARRSAGRIPATRTRPPGVLGSSAGAPGGGRRAADSGRPRVGRVESAVGSPPQPCVFVASFSRDREDWARSRRAGQAASAAGETRGQPCVGAAAAALTAAHVRLPRRVRAPQPRVGGTGVPSSAACGSPPPATWASGLAGAPGSCPPPTLSRLISLTFRGELQTRTAPLGKGQGGFSYLCLKMVCVER